MRESYKEWFKIYSSHGMSCSPLEKDLESMEEIYARRNIIVHNAGVVNAQYINTVTKSEHEIGDILTVDKAYMQNAFNTIKRITIIMMIESCKLNRENTNKYLLDIFNILFPLLQRAQYEVCEPAYALLDQKSETNTQIRIMSRVNKWICVIALRGLNEVRAEIEEFDISALNSLFQLAKVVLLQKYEQATAILEELLKRDEISATAIETWPLFLWYRTSAEYNTFREQNPDIFDIESVEVNQGECAAEIVEENLVFVDEVQICG